MNKLNPLLKCGLCAVLFCLAALKAHAQFPLNLPTLGPGDSIMIAFDAEIDSNTVVCFVSSQVEVTIGMSTILSDDPDTGAPGDATLTFLEDDEAPMPVCHDLTVELDAFGMYAYPPVDSAAIVDGTTDDCGSFTTVFDPPILTCTDVGDVLITVTYTDDAGNSSTCSATITVNDFTAPTAICQDVTLELDENGSSILTPDQVNNGSFDACGVDSIWLVDTAFTCDQAGQNTLVFLFVSDVNGNVASCGAFIFVDDVLPPSVTCPADMTAYVDSQCQVSLPDFTGLVIVTDNCDQPNISQTPAPGTILSGHGTVQSVSFFVTDDQGNSSGCAFNYSLQDTTPPIPVCQDITIDLNEVGQAMIDVDDINNGSTDNCGITMVGLSNMDFDCDDYAQSPVTVVLTVMDVAGNTASCMASVTIQDPLAVCCDGPVAMCQDITVYLDGSGNATITAADVDNGSIADCGLLGLSVSPSSFTCADLGANAVTLTVTDINNSSSSCSAQVMVLDTVSPQIFCLADVTVECGVDAIPSVELPGAEDNCAVALVTFVGEESTGNCPEIIARTFRAVDVSGNIAECVQTITIEDNIAPAIICPEGGGYLGCNPSQLPPSATVVATDSCDGLITATTTVVENDTIGCQGILVYRYTAADACGNVSTCMQSYSYKVDNEAPVMHCVKPAPIACPGELPDPSAIAASLIQQGRATAVDNCDGPVPVTYVAFDQLDNQCALAWTFGFTAVDACGNHADTCYIIVQIYHDAVPPVITCNDPPHLGCNPVLPTAQSILNQGYVTATDNCGPATIGFLPPFTQTVSGCEYMRTFRFRATDPCGNQSQVCSVTVRWTQDVTPPALVCPADLVLECDQIVPQPQLPQATDNCTLTLVTFVGEVGSGDACDSLIVRTYYAEDACGNSVACTQRITIHDTTPPMLSCPATIVLECGIDPIPEGLTTVADNCSADPFITYSDEEFVQEDCSVNVFVEGYFKVKSIIVRTYYAEDDCGNSISCTQHIIIRDDTPPMLTCPADVTIECDQDPNDLTLTGNGIAHDLCDPDAYPYVLITIEVPGGNSCSRVLQRYWAATDVCGNGGSDEICVQQITIVDTTPPVISCPSDVTIECGAPLPESLPEASDNCNSLSFTHEDSAPVGECPMVITRTHFVADLCGNVSSCTQHITIEDTTPPSIVCPVNVTIECGAPLPTTLATATDICSDEIVLAYSDEEVSQMQLTQNVNTTIIEDALQCGNNPTSHWRAYDLAAMAVSGDFELASVGMASWSAGTVQIFVYSYTGTLPSNTLNTMQMTLIGQANAMAVGDFSLTTHVLNAPVVIPAGSKFVVEQRQIAGGPWCIAGNYAGNSQPAYMNCEGSAFGFPSTPTSYQDLGYGNIHPIQVLYGSMGSCGTLIRRTHTATDVCGNVSSCFQFIAIEDTTPPNIVCPQPPVVYLECHQALPTTLATATDICDSDVDVTYSDEVFPQTCSAQVIVEGVHKVLRVIVRTHYATDDCGNVSSCTQHFVVRDDTPPQVICPPNVTINCLDPTGPEFTGYPVVTDNCDPNPQPVFVDFPSGTSCNRTIMRVWSATDWCGNGLSSNICVQTIRILDTTPPTITCPADVTIECNAPLPTTLATGTDDCNTVTFAYTDAPAMGNCPKVIMRTHTATDACGNSSQCVQKITLVDTAPPMIVCPPNLTLECNVNPIPTTLATATDACNAVTVTYTDAVYPQVCDNDVFIYGVDQVLSVIIRKHRATDACGNFATCTQRIVIRDDTPPTIVCPPNVTIQCDQDPNDVSITGVPTISDLCDPDPVSTILLTFPTYTSPCSTRLQRIWLATDRCGNGNSSGLCSHFITIVDTKPPTISCPADVTVECGSSTNPAVTGNPVVTDSCDPMPTSGYMDSFTPGCGLTGVITRTWTGTDRCGNTATCVQHITTTDSTPPTITCPPAVTIECGAPLPTTLATATDNCSQTVSVTYVDSPISDGQSNCSWTIGRTHIATDACGNTATCQQVILIVDTTPPVISCPAPITIECQEELPLTVATSTDNCSEPFVTIVNDSYGEGLCTYQVTRTFIATDDCGNSAFCTQVIYVEDTTPPSLTCPDDAFLTCDALTCLTFDEIEVGLSDSVLIPSWTEGGVTVTIRAYSKGGVPQSAGLFDSENPHPGCEDLGTPSELYGGPGISSTAPDGAPSNNQALGNVIIVQNPNVPFPDDYFLSDSLVFEFSVPVYVERLIGLDFEEEQLQTGAGVYLYGPGGVSLGFVPFNPLLGNDNSMEEVCLKKAGVQKLVVYYGSTVPGSGAVANLCYVYIPCETDEVITSDGCNNGDINVTCSDTTIVVDECTTQIERTFSAGDICGNVNEGACSQTITIGTDCMQPDIICPTDITIGCDDPVPAPDADAVVVTDNCTAQGDIIVTYVQDILDSTGCDEVIRRIYRAEDECGNSALCVQYIRREPQPLQVQISARIFLQAAMNSTGDGMEGRLNEMGYLPHNQPYTMMPYDYWGPETCADMPEDIVDWVLMQLRDVVTNEVISERAALVKKNGDIVDMDGVSPVAFNAPADWYYIVVCHRNHLDVMTLLPMDCTDGTGGCDFRTDMGDHPEGMVEVNVGMFAMIRGDVNGDHLVKYNGSNNDKNAILGHVGILTPNNQVPGYSRYDVNMDGVVKYNGSNNDKNAILSVVGLLTPNNIVQGQMYE